MPLADDDLLLVQRDATRHRTSAAEIRAYVQDGVAQAEAALAVVVHGNDANQARPTGPLRVYWEGSVSPQNAIDGDLWAHGLRLQIRVGGVFSSLEADYATVGLAAGLAEALS